jgi:hypothetical protein
MPANGLTCFQRRTTDLVAPAMVAAIIRPNHYDAFSTCLDLSGPSRLFFIKLFFIFFNRWQTVRLVRISRPRQGETLLLRATRQACFPSR